MHFGRWNPLDIIACAQIWDRVYAVPLIEIVAKVECTRYKLAINLFIAGNPGQQYEQSNSRHRQKPRHNFVLGGKPGAQFRPTKSPPQAASAKPFARNAGETETRRQPIWLTAAESLW